MKQIVTVAAAWLVIALADLPIMVVQAPDSPVHLDHLKIFSTDGAPPVLVDLGGLDGFHHGLGSRSTPFSREPLASATLREPRR